MTKEEVLEKSQKENKGKDLYESEVLRRGMRIAFLISLFTVLALCTVEWFVLKKEPNYGYVLIVFSAASGLWIYKLIHMKKKHEIIPAVFWTAIAVYCLVKVILGYMG